jgi:hypothetical protein
VFYQELPTIAKEATFLISLAAEEFIKRLSEAAQRVAERERRTTIQSRDLSMYQIDMWYFEFSQSYIQAAVVRKADEFVFLEGRSCSHFYITCSAQNHRAHSFPGTYADFNYVHWEEECCPNRSSYVDHEK